MTTTLKTCFKCGKTLPLVEFYKHNQMADGHLNKCKLCTKNDVHEHRHGKGRERVLKYDRERANNPERVEARRFYVNRWKEEHPEWRKAQSAVSRAIMDGRLTKQPCFICGANAEAHHPNYDEPLDVVWLCPAHHKQAHAIVLKY